MGNKLTGLKEGAAAKVARIEGGTGAVKKLHTMGIIPGTQIKVVRISGSGPVIIEARGSRVALGRGLAEKIVVE